MFDNAVTRNLSGANNTRESETFSDQWVEDRTKVHEYNNDFDEFNTANYTITTLGVAGTTFAAIAGDNGLIQAASSANANAGYVLQNVRADYTFAANFRLFADFIFSVDSALANTLVGLFNTTAAPFTPANITDGVYMQTLGTTAINVIGVAGGGAKTTQAAVAVLNPGLTNFVNFKLYWDGGVYAAAPSGRIIWELSGAGVVAPVRGEFSSVSGAAVGLPAGFPGTTAVNPTFAFTASTGVARTFQADLFSVIKDRVNINATPVF